MTEQKLLISEKRAAELLSVSQKHLANQRKEGAAPYIKLGTKILYDPEALREWVAQQGRNGAAS